ALELLLRCRDLGLHAGRDARVDGAELDQPVGQVAVELLTRELSAGRLLVLLLRITVPVVDRAGQVRARRLGAGIRLRADAIDPGRLRAEAGADVIHVLGDHVRAG